MLRVLTAEQQELLQESISALDLPLRTQNALECIGILTVNDLLMTTESRLKQTANIGQKTIDEIFVALADRGFHRMKASEESAKDKKKKVAAGKANKVVKTRKASTSKSAGTTKTKAAAKTVKTGSRKKASLGKRRKVSKRK